jgi:flavin reductase (DIM6/NTAB) family NADH-FMN oxidoreductase RutF
MNKLILSQLDKTSLAYRNFINCLNGHKSPLLVGTINQQGQNNLSLIANCMHLGADPALLALQFRPMSESSHGLKNILREPFFSINFLSSQMIKKAHQTSARYDESQSEFEAVGLTPYFTANYPCPLVSESPLSLVMKRDEVLEVKQNGSNLVIALILEVLSAKPIDWEHFWLADYSPVVSNGLETYHLVKSAQKLTYAKVDRETKIIDEKNF